LITLEQVHRTTTSASSLLREGPLKPKRFCVPMWDSISDMPRDPQNGEFGFRADLEQIWIWKAAEGKWYRGETMTVVT
jgi:hypothetical protein